MQDTLAAIRRTEAAIRALDQRMQSAVGDLDYESHLHEKRALTAALLALHKRREREEKDDNFSQNSALSISIKDK